MIFFRKPTTFATCEFKGEEKSIFCLPGNPLSAFVTFHLFVIPYLKVFEGYLDYQLPSINVRVVIFFLFCEISKNFFEVADKIPPVLITFL